MKILITGFEPFRGEKINPSGKLLQSWQNHPQVDTLLLPVSYEKAFLVLQDFLHRQLVEESKTYAAIIMLGQAGGRSKISLERLAVNWREKTFADEEGFLPEQPGKIKAGSENALFSTLPLEKIKAALEAANIPVEISLSAGAFVCNNLFFETAEYLEESFASHKTICGFVHVPYLPEQVLNKPDKAAMEFPVMEKALQIIIASLLSQSDA